MMCKTFSFQNDLTVNFANGCFRSHQFSDARLVVVTFPSGCQKLRAISPSLTTRICSLCWTQKALLNKQNGCDDGKGT